MKNDLIAQLFEYGEQTRASRDMVTVADVLERTEQVRPFPNYEPDRRTAWPRIAGIVLAAAAVVVVVLSVPILLSRGTEEVAPANATPATTVPPPTVVEDAEPVPSPSTTLATEPVEPSAPITGMAWQQITPDGIDADTGGRTAMVSGGDRFLYFHGANKTVSTSFDGISWTNQSIQGSVNGIHDFVGWQGTIVGTGCGGANSSGGPITPNAGCVAVIHPDGTVARHSFDGDINKAGIGPSGIVVIVTNHHDENGLQYADEDVVAWNLTGRDINEFSVFEVTNGVLHVESHDGVVADYVLSEHGYADIERPDASGWYSQDGEEWIPIPDLPASSQWDLIGTKDGFIGIADDRDGGDVVWHSPNGLDWRELGQSPAGGLSRWSDGAIVAGIESVWYLSGLGITETPLAATEYEPAISASGNVGMVKIDIEPVTMDLRQILYSPKVEAWINTKVPLEMRDLELTIDAFHLPVEAVATDTKVILLLNEAIEGEDSSRLVWFLGTPITD